MTYKYSHKMVDHSKAYGKSQNKKALYKPDVDQMNKYQLFNLRSKLISHIVHGEGDVEFKRKLIDEINKRLCKLS